MRHVLVACLVVLAAAPARAQTPPPDSEVAAGIHQVEEGDYDTAILTLDAAARRLATDPARSRELSQAYLYLGVAYVGKGHDAAAKAKFREAVKQLRDLTLSPDKFPPKVIDIFEAARDEVSHEPAAPAPVSVPPPASVKKGGGSRKVLFFGGLGAVAAGGAALALKKKGDEGCRSVEAQRSGPLSRPNDALADLVGGPAIEPGVWEGELFWTGGPPDSDVHLTALQANGSPIVDGGLIAAGHRKVEWNGEVGVTYSVRAMLVSGGPVNFELSIFGPCIN